MTFNRRDFVTTSSLALAGAALARLEGQVALRETLLRFPTWEVDEDRLERVHTSTVRGYTSVRMQVG